MTSVEHDGKLFTVRSGIAVAVRAPVLINCAGAWAGVEAAQFGEAVPIHSGHPAMAATEPLPNGAWAWKAGAFTAARWRVATWCWVADRAWHWMPTVPDQNAAPSPRWPCRPWSCCLR